MTIIYIDFPFITLKKFREDVKISISLGIASFNIHWERER